MSPGSKSSTGSAVSAGRTQRTASDLHDTSPSLNKMRPTVTMVEDGRVRRMKENVREDIGNLQATASAADPFCARMGNP
eukprot:11171742-Lingulodinium_polyedra.AAC.1